MTTKQQILSQVKEYIQQNIPLVENDRILVGLSGGADSVALLSILKELGYCPFAAHCHFALRGEESDRDRNFAKQIATKLGVPFIEVQFDTLRYATEKKISVEMACRELRYAWFETQRIALDCRWHLSSVNLLRATILGVILLKKLTNMIHNICALGSGFSCNFRSICCSELNLSLGYRHDIENRCSCTRKRAARNIELNI